MKRNGNFNNFYFGSRVLNNKETERLQRIHEKKVRDARKRGAGEIPKYAADGKLRPNSKPQSQGTKDQKERRTATAESEATTAEIITPHGNIPDTDPQAVLQRSFTRMDELAMQHQQNFDDLAELRLQVFGRHAAEGIADAAEGEAPSDMLEETVCKLNTFLDEQLAHIQINEYDGLVELEDDVLCEYGAASAQLDDESCKAGSVAASWEKWGADDELKQKILAAGSELASSHTDAPADHTEHEPAAVPDGDALIGVGVGEALVGAGVGEALIGAGVGEDDVFNDQPGGTAEERRQRTTIEEDLSRTQLLVKLKEAERKIASLEDALQVAMSPPREPSGVRTSNDDAECAELDSSFTEDAPRASCRSTDEPAVRADLTNDLSDAAAEPSTRQGDECGAVHSLEYSGSPDMVRQSCEALEATVEASEQCAEVLTVLGAQPFGAESLETALDF